MFIFSLQGELTDELEAKTHQLLLEQSKCVV